MQTIHLLSEQTINQIAAGEVIEGPSSVVKELLENSLDAGATVISVEIKGGGLGQITVSDNGKGMNRLDATLSLQRHATSKLQTADELFSLRTMGFRGEALASIASISKLTLITSDGAPEGTKIECTASQVTHEGPASRAQGTTIDVRSLFYNVPARKKFQKSTPRLIAEVNKVVTELSLAHPFVSFELTSDGKRLFFAAPEQELGEYWLRRTQAALGDPFGKGSFPVDFDEGGIAIRGVLGAPADSRANRLAQHLFVNSRAITSAPLSYAVKEGYGTRLEPNRFPAFVLHLTLPPALLDVNVHPQKKEVRFKEEALLRAHVLRAVSSSLIKTLPAPQPTWKEARISFEEVAARPATSSAAPTWKASGLPFRPNSEGIRFEEEAPKNEAQSHFELSLPPIQPIGVFRTFLLFDGGEGLILVDLIAARARLLYDSLETAGAPMASQKLLFPLTLSFSSLEMGRILPDLPLLEQCGFEMRSIGTSALLVEGYPPYLKEDQLKDVILDLTTLQDPSRKRAAVASRLARRGAARFTQIEAVRLYEAVQKSSDPNHCPLGKVIHKELTLNELGRLVNG